MSWLIKKAIIMMMFVCGANLFDMTERPLRTVHLWDDPPPSLQRTPTLLSSGQAPFNAPPPPGGQSIRRTEGDPHLRLLDHIQVLTGNSDDSSSTAGEIICLC